VVLETPLGELWCSFKIISVAKKSVCIKINFPVLLNL